MTKTWENIERPPIVLAVMEVRFQPKSKFDVSFLKSNDSKLLEHYPKRSDNFSGNINLPAPNPGISTAQISSQQVGYTYINQDKTQKIAVTNEHIVFAMEGKYTGWEDFKREGLFVLSNFKHILDISTIHRTSVRIINKLSLPSSNPPEDYFNTLITARKDTIEDTIDSYFIKYTQRIPEYSIRTNVIQSLEDIEDDNFNFIFDIDVLSHEVIDYNVETIEAILIKIREIKNSIFFKNLTDKTKQLL